ncbi:MAG: general secretion pathway protein K [Verrucomicrobiales bacterium]|jgi:general secretion pathway protein K
MRPRQPSSERGAALAIVLASIVIVSLSIAGVIKLTKHQTEKGIFDASLHEARLIAESGIALGTHPDVTPIDEVLHQVMEPSGFQLDVKVVSEQGRILVNFATDDFIAEGLEELFILWGVNPDDAAMAADSIADWVDTDRNERTNGAENSWYAQAGYDEYPRNADFGSIEELLLVRGMDEVVKVKPDWRNYFTLYGDGTIDVNSAEADVIAAFTGVHEADAQRFVDTRNGPDGELGTPDDELFSNETASDATDLLNISTERAQELGARLTLEGSVIRVESTATVANLRYTLSVIADRESGEQLARIGQ